MPVRPRRPCPGVGCPELLPPGQRYCPKCEQARRDRGGSLFSDKRRGTAASRGYGYRWQKARKTFLASNPLCRSCEAEGVTRAASDVDHITPHRGDQTLFWDRGNWQPLCSPCHKAKTARGE